MPSDPLGEPLGDLALGHRRPVLDALANDVSPGTGTFGGDRNTIHLVDGEGIEDWPVMTKREVAQRLAERIARHLEVSRSGRS